VRRLSPARGEFGHSAGISVYPVGNFGDSVKSPAPGANLLIEDGARLYPVEIKSGRTLHEDFFKNLQFFHKISGNPLEHGWVIYGGSEQQTRSYGNVAGSQSALL
jgi:hypothetical protein